MAPSDQPGSIHATESAPPPTEGLAPADSVPRKIGSIPAWFLKRRERLSPPDNTASPVKPGAKRIAPPRIIIRVVDEGGAPLSWREEFKQWLRRDGYGVGISLLLHAIAVFCLWGTLVRGNAGSTDVSTILMKSAANDGSDALETGIEPVLVATNSGSQSESERERQNETRPEAFATELQADVELIDGDLPIPPPVVKEAGAAKKPAQRAKRAGKGEEESADKSSGKESGSGKPVGANPSSGGYSMPAKGKIVKKGSFSAWTVPSNPIPFTPYVIVVQVEWPKAPRTRSLMMQHRADVTGTVVGSDGWTQSIEETSFFYPRASQFVIAVPGGETAVEDAIHVESKILRESQDLKITF